MEATSSTELTRIVETDAPARLDSLPWSRFHTLVVVALGVTWILDGLEVTLVGALSPAIAAPGALALSATQVGLSASVYLAGAIAGALTFGWLTDRYGRKKLFTTTVAVYVVATLCTGLSWSFSSFALFRFMTGFGIGGEYGAVNSAIQELIPARRRGVTDLIVNGTFWLGAALGALGSIVALDPALVAPEHGWRAAFIVGGALGVVVLALRRYVPESPRWLMTHGRVEEADAIVADIERRVGRTPAERAFAYPKIALRVGEPLSWFTIGHTILVRWRSRAVLNVTLMATQAFCYNALFFTYALVLTRFYDVAPERVGWFLLPFALGNLCGPLLLGPLFDSWGRKPMICATYGLAGVLMAGAGALFAQGALSAAEQTAAWTIIFFFASAGASAAYLTIGESFPLEIRAVAISLFYAFGVLIGGVAGPVAFGALIENGSRGAITIGYMFAAALMLLGAATEWRLGIASERKSLEEVTPPLSLAT